MPKIEPTEIGKCSVCGVGYGLNNGVLPWHTLPIRFNSDKPCSGSHKPPQKKHSLEVLNPLWPHKK